MEQIEIKLQVPKVVDQLWRALGYDETDYQYDFLETLRSSFDAICNEPPKAQEALEILEKAKAKLKD